MKLTISLTDIPRCSKAGCKHRGMMHRHHMSCEWMFVKQFAHTDKRRTKQYIKFKRRYVRFNKKDVALLCPGHHGEIHERCDILIRTATFKYRRHIADFNWRQAHTLMAQCKAEYLRWKDIKTNRTNPRTTRLQPWSDT